MFKGKKSILGGLILVFFFFMSFWGDKIAPFDMDRLFSPYLLPCGDHFLGTNNIGRDILSELIYATRVSFIIGLIAAGLATVLGTMVGCVAGYYRSWIDDILMRITDVFLLIPTLPLIIILVSYMGPGISNVILVISISSWPGTARVVRAQVLKIRESPFIMNAKSLGGGDPYIILHHIIPNTLELILAKATLATASAMLTEAGISFIGLGDPNHTSWGGMLHDVMEGAGLINGLWWWYLPPIACISLAVIGFNYAGQGILSPEAIPPPDLNPKKPYSKNSYPKNHYPKNPLPWGSVPIPKDPGIIFRTQNLCVFFRNRENQMVKAVDSVDFTLGARDKIAILGETGAGKSLLLLALLKLLPEDADMAGTIYYQGQDMAGFSDKKMCRIRGTKMAYVPQGAGNALNPVMNIGSQVGERTRVHFGTGKKAALKQAQTLLSHMGIGENRICDYPHQFSGGMKQRVLLASAMILNDGVLLADEPTKGLDMKNKKAVLEMIHHSRTKACVIVTHDPWFARQFAKTVLVMFQGLIVESAPCESFFSHSFHPFSQSLLSALPSNGLKVRCGYVPNNFSRSQTGCPFVSRCDVRLRICQKCPPLFKKNGHRVRCWHYAA